MFQLLQSPDTIIGKNFTQKWEDDKGDEKWWTGTITSKTNGEYKLEYTADTRAYFLTPEEVLSDIVTGELLLSWDFK